MLVQEVADMLFHIGSYKTSIQVKKIITEDPFTAGTAGSLGGISPIMVYLWIMIMINFILIQEYSS